MAPRVKRSIIDNFIENHHMTKINAIDIKSGIIKTTIDVFDKMLSLNINYFEPDMPLSIDGKRIVGSVGFVGEAKGIISIQMAYGFARFLTGSLLDIDLDESANAEEVDDVIGELSNMIGGGLKSRLCDSGLSCTLSIPSIIYGSNFKMLSMNGATRTTCFFCYEKQPVIVETSMKAEKQSVFSGSSPKKLLTS